jgi:predicted phosphohydrolase
MSYKDILKKQIMELEKKIQSDSQDKQVLEKELQRLKLAEFDEDMRENSNQQLLQE